MSSLVKFIVGGKEYTIDSTIFQNIVEDVPSYLPRQFANENFKKQDVYNYPDRDPEVFEAVLRYYRTKGMFTIGTHLQEQPEFVKTELEFWGIDVPFETVCKKKIQINQNDLLDSNDIADEFTRFCIEYIKDTCDRYKAETKLPLFSTHVFDFETGTSNGPSRIEKQFFKNMQSYDERKQIFIHSGYYMTTKAMFDEYPSNWPLTENRVIRSNYVNLTIKFVDISKYDEKSLSEQFDIMETGKNNKKKEDNNDNQDDRMVTNQKLKSCQIS